MSELLDRGTAETYASWFRALADPSRVQIVEYLARQGKPMSVGDLVTAVGLAQSVLSPYSSVSAYRSAAPFVLAIAALLYLSRRRVVTISRATT